MFLLAKFLFVLILFASTKELLADEGESDQPITKLPKMLRFLRDLKANVDQNNQAKLKLDARMTRLETQTNLKLENFFNLTSLKLNNVMSLSEKVNETMHLMDSKLDSFINSTDIRLTKVVQEQGELLQDVHSILSTIKLMEQFHFSRATFYSEANHKGITEDIDFRNCLSFVKCCKNMLHLDNKSQSVNTHGTCVLVYDQKDCLGNPTIIKPGTPNHSDMGALKITISSVQTC